MGEARLRESISNILLLLYTIHKTNEQQEMDDDRKLQKMVFLAEKNLVRSKLKALDYQFHKWQMGPYSANVSRDLDVLKGLGLVRPGWPIGLTSEGVNLLDSCSELLMQNKRFIGFVDRIVNKYAHLDSKSIMDVVYDMVIVVPRTLERMRIDDVPMGTPILFKTSSKRAKAIFEIDESWLATLEIAFNQEIIDSIAEAYDDAREGRASDFRSVRTT